MLDMPYPARRCKPQGYAGEDLFKWASRLDFRSNMRARGKNVPATCCLPARGISPKQMRMLTGVVLPFVKGYPRGANSRQAVDPCPHQICGLFARAVATFQAGRYGDAPRDFKKLRIASQGMTEIARSIPRRRTDVRQPEAGFVFCSFNDADEITSTIFDVWMSLLRQIDNSIL
jgi:hypothetical protein